MFIPTTARLAKGNICDSPQALPSDMPQSVGLGGRTSSSRKHENLGELCESVSKKQLWGGMRAGRKIRQVIWAPQELQSVNTYHQVARCVSLGYSTYGVMVASVHGVAEVIRKLI
eukprot:gene12451-biopygen6350